MLPTHPVIYYILKQVNNTMLKLQNATHPALNNKLNQLEFLGYLHKIQLEQLFNTE